MFVYMDRSVCVWLRVLTHLYSVSLLWSESVKHCLSVPAPAANVHPVPSARCAAWTTLSAAEPSWERPGEAHNLGTQLGYHIISAIEAPSQSARNWSTSNSTIKRENSGFCLHSVSHQNYCSLYKEMEVPIHTLKF